ncbi:MAG: thiol-disulfide oxidoreductase DCC family protein [Myxococcota bacterium]
MNKTGSVDRGGWTGGQYSIFRVVLAIHAACVLGARLSVSGETGWDRPWLAAFLGLGLLACFPLALGMRDRTAAGVITVAVGVGGAVADGAPLLLPTLEVLVTTALLILHLCVAPLPFGARDAADRVDPRGDWRRAPWLGHLAWCLLALTHLARAASGIEPNAFLQERLGISLPGLTLAVLAFEAALFLFGLRSAMRPKAWTALILFRIACLAAFGALPGDASVFLLLLFACEPIWFAGRSLQFPAAGEAEAEMADATADGDLNQNRPARLYYDGDCGFCHGSIRFVLSEENATPPSLRLRFAPLASEGFADRVAQASEFSASEVPDSIVLDLEDGRLLTQSAAALEIAARLGGIWLGIAKIARHVPPSALDAAYDAFAKIRKRIFAAPKGACPILPPDMRARFDL